MTMSNKISCQLLTSPCVSDLTYMIVSYAFRKNSSVTAQFVLFQALKCIKAWRLFKRFFCSKLFLFVAFLLPLYRSRRHKTGLVSFHCPFSYYSQLAIASCLIYGNPVALTLCQICGSIYNPFLSFLLFSLLPAVYVNAFFLMQASCLIKITIFIIPFLVLPFFDQATESRDDDSEKYSSGNKFV